jgi:cation transport ATPase
MTQSQEEHDEETRRERVNRELIELLNELRVALPGVQVLFAFLLAVPFASGWDRTTSFQHAVFFVTLTATAVSTAFFIAPSAYHRIHFRNHEKEQLLFTSNYFAVAGIFFLAISMCGVIVLVTSVIYSSTATLVLGVTAALVFGGLWFGLPLYRRASR